MNSCAGDTVDGRQCVTSEEFAALQMSETLRAIENRMLRKELNDVREINRALTNDLTKVTYDLAKARRDCRDALERADHHKSRCRQLRRELFRLAESSEYPITKTTEETT